MSLWPSRRPTIVRPMPPERRSWQGVPHVVRSARRPGLPACGWRPRAASDPSAVSLVSCPGSRRGSPRTPNETVQDLEGGSAEEHGLPSGLAVRQEHDAALEVHLLPPEVQDLAQAAACQDQEADRGNRIWINLASGGPRFPSAGASLPARTGRPPTGAPSSPPRGVPRRAAAVPPTSGSGRPSRPRTSERQRRDCRLEARVAPRT